MSAIRSGVIPINGKRVSKIRNARGWSQQQVAERSGISRSYISDIEMGRKQPRLVFAHQLAQVLGVSVEELVSKEDQPQVRQQMASLREEG